MSKRKTKQYSKEEQKLLDLYDKVYNEAVNWYTKHNIENSLLVSQIAKESQKLLLSEQNNKLSISKLLNKALKNVLLQLKKDIEKLKNG